MHTEKFQLRNRKTMNLREAHKNNFRDFVFYDIECFAQDSLVVFKDIDGQTIKMYHNNFEGLEDFIMDKVLVGYNNYHYDDYMLSGMMGGMSPKALKNINDNIIEKGIYDISLNHFIESLDCFQQIDVAMPSLKKIEANLGLSIEETSVPFDIDRALTQEELQETISYCESDVNATIAVFKLRWFNYFVPKFILLDMLPPYIQQRAKRWNTTTIAAQILMGASSLQHWDKVNLGISEKDTDIMLSKVSKDIQDIWSSEDMKPVTIHDLGCEITFAKGGLHGASLKKKDWRNVKLLDVTSMYPFIIINLNALGTSTTQKYKDIVDLRVSVKHSDPILSDALKVRVINSVYGLMGNEYSKLYNPNAELSVCIFGQIAVYCLAKRLYEAGYEIVNINTDGVAFVGYSDDYKEIQKEWEEEFSLGLELDEFEYWYQKDVNNYIARYRNGNLKLKGGTVNKYFDPDDYLEEPLLVKSNSWTRSNTLGIIHKCIVDKILYNKDFVDTILENLDKPILFQYILQCGKTYIGTFDEEGREYQKVNRVFATKDGITLKKHKELVNKNGETVISEQLYPNAPKNMYVYNGDLRDFDNFNEIVDVDFYVNLATERYNKLWK